MSRLVFFLGGVLLGSSLGAQAGTRYGAPGVGAGVFVAVLLVGVAWFAGQRDRASAVAVAVAKAEARAEAAAEAQAAAIAQAAVHLHMAGSGSLEPTRAAGAGAEGPAPRPGRHALTGSPRAEVVAADPVAVHLLPQVSNFLPQLGGEGSGV